MKNFTEAEKMFLREMLEDTLKKPIFEGNTISRTGDFTGIPYTLSIKFR